MFREYLDEILNYEKRIGFFFKGHQLNGEEVEDLTQEALCRIYESVETFKESSSLGTWIYSICRNVLYEYRRKKRPALVIDDLEITVPDKTDFIIFDILVESLPGYLKPVYWKRYKLDMKIREIALDLSMAEGTVKYYIFLIKKHLRELS